MDTRVDGQDVRIVTLRVGDVQRSVGFYSALLGLRRASGHRPRPDGAVVLGRATARGFRPVLRLAQACGASAPETVRVCAEFESAWLVLDLYLLARLLDLPSPALAVTARGVSLHLADPDGHAVVASAPHAGAQLGGVRHERSMVRARRVRLHEPGVVVEEVDA